MEQQPLALIVEDDRDIVALFRQVLDIAGYRTEIALDGAEAMERISSIIPDIVLLDLQLPGMPGLEILQRMRSDESLSTIPVVVITAYSHYSRNMTVEPDLLLQKPVDIIQLKDLVLRLKATKGGMHEPAHDRATGLYSMPFFSVRLTFSLERIKQTILRRFGVLFVDIENLEKVTEQLEGRELTTFQRKLADQFKSTLRPTDTMAWSADENCFLTLIEDIPTDDVPPKIAARVGDGMKTYLEKLNVDHDLHANLGVLICDAEYADTTKIMEDVHTIRAFLRDGTHESPAIFTREDLHGKDPE